MKPIDNPCLQRRSQPFSHKLRDGLSQAQGPAFRVPLSFAEYIIIETERRPHTIMMPYFKP